MKILLAAPVPPRRVRDRDSFMRYAFPLYGVNLLATALRRDGHQVKVLDSLSCLLETRSAKIDVLHRLEKEMPAYDVLAISNLASAMNRHCVDAAAIARKHGKKVVIGGVQPTVERGCFLKRWPGLFDAEVAGEGEIVLPVLIRRLQSKDPRLAGLEGVSFLRDGKVEIAKKARRIDALDALPGADYSAYDVPHWKPRTVAVNMTRGCPYRCPFCSSSFLWGKLRRRGADSVAGEIERLCSALKPDKIYIDDDNFIVDKEGLELLARIKDLRRREGYDFELLIRTRLDKAGPRFLDAYKSAGGRVLELGLESSERLRRKVLGGKLPTRDIQDKLAHARRIGLKLYVFLMLGIPTETLDDLREIWRDLKALDPEGVRPSILHLYPNTPLWESFGPKDGNASRRSWALDQDCLTGVQGADLRRARLFQRVFTERFNKSAMTRELYGEQHAAMASFSKAEIRRAVALLEAR